MSGTNEEYNITDNSLKYKDEIIIKNINKSISLQQEKNNKGIFLNYKVKKAEAENLINIGDLKLNRFTAVYRDNTCWMIPRIGSLVSEIPVETQFLLVEIERDMYIILIPVLDKAFRCSLQGSVNNRLVLLAESGDSNVKINSMSGLYLITGTDPYHMMKTAAREIVDELQTVRLREEKKLPEFINYYGWCTYNAFYADVSHDKVLNILKQYSDKGITPGFLILDAGWQSTSNRQLTSFAADKDKFPGGLQKTIEKVKNKYDLKKFLTWQTYNGFWQGIDPDSFPEYQPESKFYKVSAGNEDIGEQDNNEYNEATVGENFYPANLISNPTGMVEPDFFQFYFDYHDYLRKQGVDGVKIDAMTWIEGFGEGKGGRIEMMKKLLSAVEGSTAVNFQDELLNCSSCSNDFIFQTLKANLTRTSADFFPDRPETHGLHIFTNAHTSFWMGEFVHPDWDMFQTGHEAGDFHAAARAISGGPVYSTDIPGEEDVSLIKKLRLSDGRVPLCTSYAKICKDSLFVDPVSDNKIIKIFNTNKFGGIIGAFNCCYHPDEEITVSGRVKVKDVEGIPEQDYVVYSCRNMTLIKVDIDEEIEVDLPELEYDLMTVMPVKKGFAPVGLIDKYNSGGTIEEFEFINRKDIRIVLQDGGEFLAYSEKIPEEIYINGERENFTFNEKNNSIKVNIKNKGSAEVKIMF